MRHHWGGFWVKGVYAAPCCPLSVTFMCFLTRLCPLPCYVTGKPSPHASCVLLDLPAARTLNKSLFLSIVQLPPHTLNLIRRKIVDKSHWRDTLQNACPVLLNHVKIKVNLRSVTASRILRGCEDKM